MTPASVKAASARGRYGRSTDPTGSAGGAALKASSASKIASKYRGAMKRAVQDLGGGDDDEEDGDVEGDEKAASVPKKRRRSSTGPTPKSESV